MAIEIERKFIVIDNEWRQHVVSSQVIRQGYLADGERASIRVRTSGSAMATLTIKSSVSRLAREEYEYPIPISDAALLLRLSEGRLIDKIRHNVPCGGLTWEVDVFEGDNGGLVIAEVELERADQPVELPTWVGMEVTGDSCFSNATLGRRPFSCWSAKERAAVQGFPRSIAGGLSGHVVATCRGATHDFSKSPQSEIRLIAGLGIEGDAHMGTTVKHRSRVRRDPSRPNLRQVHLLQAEFLDEALWNGFAVAPGALGENITTRGLDVLSLPRGTLLRLGSKATVQLTGLRNPCHQIDDFRKGLLALTLRRDEQESVVRKAGVMAVVVTTGTVRPADPIVAELPVQPFDPLEPI